MRNALVPLLVLATVACSSVGPSARADDPAGSPHHAGEWRPVPSSSPRVDLVDDDARALPTYFSSGRRFVLGGVGERYAIRIVNPTARRVEAVVSVDGLDAIDGKPASFAKRGYLIAPFGEVTVDGWRTSLDSVAAFRFSSVASSYAARTGTDRNVGVIGVALFRERPVAPRPMPPEVARAAPGAPPPAARSSAAAPPSAAGAARAESKAADAEQRSDAPAESRPGLGTEFGEQHDSYATEVPFERASSRPDALTELRYDDRRGLVARGIRIPPVDGRWEETERRDRAEPFPEARFARPPQ
jgi:hypothetical protein